MLLDILCWYSLLPSAQHVKALHLFYDAGIPPEWTARAVRWLRRRRPKERTEYDRALARGMGRTARRRVDRILLSAVPRPDISLTLAVGAFSWSCKARRRGISKARRFFDPRSK